MFKYCWWCDFGCLSSEIRHFIYEWILFFAYPEHILLMKSFQAILFISLLIYTSFISSASNVGDPLATDNTGDTNSLGVDPANNNNSMGTSFATNTTTTAVIPNVADEDLKTCLLHTETSHPLKPLFDQLPLMNIAPTECIPPNWLTLQPPMDNSLSKCFQFCLSKSYLNLPTINGEVHSGEKHGMGCNPCATDNDTSHEPNAGTTAQSIRVIYFCSVVFILFLTLLGLIHLLILPRYVVILCLGVDNNLSLKSFNFVWRYYFY